MNFKQSALLLLSLTISNFCYAELKDPTKPAFYSAEINLDDSPLDLTLSSIWISGDSKRATINGITGKQGETLFATIKIIKILNNAVIIEQNGQRNKLFLLTQSFKTRKPKQTIQ